MRGVVVASLLVVGCLAACSSKDDSASPTDGTISCTDGRRNGSEVGVDCGGTCPKKCDGAKCAGNDECASGTCQPDGKCAPMAGKSCGVGLPNDCEIGDSCSQDDDCKLDVCSDDQKCVDPPADVHTDGRRNGGETGIDCGGVIAQTTPCPEGQGCKTSDDCISTCNDDGTCAAPGPTDGKKNNDETDIDCGGTQAPPCTVGQGCAVNKDCDLIACTGALCVVPTETDGVQNGGETDVDCGGPGVANSTVSYVPPRCVIDKICAADADCASGGCALAATGGKCALPSCATAETAGITTCGSGETGEAGAQHESCCRSLVLPTRTGRRLDKYEISTGRYRTFINKAGPNIKGWVQSYVAAHPTSALAAMVNTYPTLLQIYPDHDRGDALSLTAHLSQDIDNYAGIRGCSNKAGSYSANTYWQDAAHLSDYNVIRSLPREQSDEKSMNCAMPIMYAAFCAWDGGELALMDDYYDVWPTSQAYPWGPNNLCTVAGTDGRGPYMNPGNIMPCGAYNWCNGTDNNGGFHCQNLSLATDGVHGVFYEWPRGTDRSKDNEPLIGAPGRFPMDSTLAKSGGESWKDIFANLAEYTGNLTNANGAFCDFSASTQPGKTPCTNAQHGFSGSQYNGIPNVGLVGTTWEGHIYNRTVNGIVATFSYGKFGARCARPANPY